MKLHVIPNGWNENDLAHIVLNPHLGTDTDRSPRAEWVRVPIWSVLIETDDGRKILFDTASHPEAMTERWPANQRSLTPYTCPEKELLVPSLARLGVQPEDIDVVIASHLHEDHAGGLEFFPNATAYVHENELKNALLLHATRPETEMGAYIKRDIQKWLELGLRWRPVTPEEGDVEIAPGVTVLNWGPGHTFGMLGLHVQLPKTGSIILCSDAILSAANYGPPAQLNGFPYDSLRVLATTELVRRMAKKHNAAVWFGHDMEQFASLTHASDGYYD